MATYLRKFATLNDLNTAKIAGTLQCPNTALIMADGSVVYTPSLIKENIGIRGANGVCYTITEWNALAAADKPNADGVYVYDPSTAKGFVIHPTLNSGAQWCTNTSTFIPGCNTGGIADLAGASNSAAVLAFISENPQWSAPLFSWAAGLSFLDSSLSPYVPAAGEMEIIRLNQATINTCRTAIGQSEIVFPGNNWWSSTQYGAYTSWSWGSSGWFNFSKDSSCRGLAVAAF